MIESYLHRLELLDKSLTSLEDDIKYKADSIEIYYAVDFSELFAYLNVNHKTVKQLGVEINEQVVNSGEQHQLSLSHLFNSLTETLYLLPPHTIELWSYTRDQADNQLFSDNLEKAQELLKQISPEDAFFLRNLENISILTEEQEKKLFSIVKDDFEKLCAAATNFYIYKKQATDLKKMLQEEKLSYQIEDLLKQTEVAEGSLKAITFQEETDVLNVFSNFFSEKQMLTKYDQKIRDSRAILHIRNLNRQLSSQKIRLNFVTRDTSIKHVCQILKDDPDFYFPQIETFLRSPESIFFDLILLSCVTSQEKLEWISESRNTLDKIKTELLETKFPKRDTSYSKLYFEEQRKEVLHNIFKSWSERINLQLSIAIKSIPFISEFISESKNESLGKADTQEKKLLNSVKNLFEFIKTNEYEQKAIKEAKRVFEELTNDGLRMNFLKRLKDIYGDLEEFTVNKIFDTKGVFSLIYPSSSMMPFIRFTSESYEKKLGEFKQNINIGSQSSKELIPLIEQATIGVGEPEDFMFMAFILGIMKFWKDALQLVQRALDIEYISFDIAQARYFKAFIQRKIGEVSSDILVRIEFYEYAADNVLKALLHDDNDPRYLKEFGAIVLMYHEAWRKLADSSDYKYSILKERGGNLNYLDLDKAKEYLKKALEIQTQRSHDDDIRLKIEILNNILFAEFLSEIPDREYGRYILKLLKQQKDLIKNSQPLTTVGIEPFVKDSEIMFNAKIAFLDKEPEQLRKYIQELEEIRKVGFGEISAYQQESNQEHIELLNKFLKTIENLPEYI